MVNIIYKLLLIFVLHVLSIQALTNTVIKSSTEEQNEVVSPFDPQLTKHRNHFRIQEQGFLSSEMEILNNLSINIKSYVFILLNEIRKEIENIPSQTINIIEENHKKAFEETRKEGIF